MTTQPDTIIEGETREVDEPRALAVVQPGQALVAAATVTGPQDMLAKATAIATALSKMVEAQGLYTNIRGKKYPHVEAWMTIGRMDNVVAREVDKPIKNDDGSWEATVELVRLSDGMVIGRGSAMAGGKNDGDWTGRPDHVKRSMAVTRATSRAFRHQYSWIMALAGYQPTPADEMPPQEPQDGPQRPLGAHDSPPPRPELERRANGLVGTVTRGKPPVDLELRETPEDGMAWGFKLTQGRKGYQALALGPLAEALHLAAGSDFDGKTVTVWGRMDMIPWEKQGEPMPPFARIAIERVQTPDWTLPADEPPETEDDWMPGDPRPRNKPEADAERAELDALPW